MVDQLFVWRDALERYRPPYDGTVVHVDFNNSSIQKLDNFYLNRKHHAQVVRNLATMRVAAQAYDFIFAARSNPEDDAALLEATETSGSVYFGLAMALTHAPHSPSSLRPEERRYLSETAWHVKIEGDASAFYTGSNPLLTFLPLATVARGLGYLSIVADRNGVFRRIPLLVRYGSAFYPSFALRVACDYLGVSPENIVVRPGQHILLRQARRPGAATPQDIAIPIDRQGLMLVNFVGTWERLRHYNLADILLASGDRDELELWSEELAGKIVVVADVSTGASDIGPVPLDRHFPLSALHSNTIDNIITGNFLRPLAAVERIGIEVLLLLLLLLFRRWITTHWIVLAAFLLGVAYVGFFTACFFYGQVVGNLLRPLMILGFATIALVVQRYMDQELAALEHLRQRDFVRDVFGRYLNDTVVEELLGTPRGLEMGGELRQITLLVSDLRGFTSLAARLTPPEVITILNRYFERMVDVIARYRGTVDELMGDGMLVFFGAPLQSPDDPQRAVACAIEMQLALIQFNAEQRAQHLPELAMGIGLNTGEVVVGNIGSLKRSKYGAVGSAINTTYRIESHTLGGQILLSPSIYAQVCDLVHVNGTVEAQFKGLAQPITLYSIHGMAGDSPLALPEKPPEQVVRLAIPVPLECFCVEEKVVAATAIPGTMTALAGTTAEMTLAEQIAMHSNVKLHLLPRHAPPIPDIYAKVVACHQGETGEAYVRLEFTSLPETARGFLTQLATPV